MFCRFLLFFFSPGKGSVKCTQILWGIYGHAKATPWTNTSSKLWEPALWHQRAQGPVLKRAAVIGGSTWISHSWRTRVSVHRSISLQREAQRWLRAVKVCAGSGVERTLSCDVSIVPSSQGLHTLHPSVCLTDLCHFTVSVQLEGSHKLITLCGLITLLYKAEHQEERFCFGLLNSTTRCPRNFTNSWIRAENVLSQKMKTQRALWYVQMIRLC